MKEFITIWPTIEGDVSVNNPSLYTKVESQTPVIMVKGSEEKYQKQLESLISQLCCSSFSQQLLRDPIVKLSKVQWEFSLSP